jgi:hypothetical protein
VDDPAQFLTAEQVYALTDATPWPYDVMVHVAGWSGLRAGELAGLQLGDVDLSPSRGSSGCMSAAMLCEAPCAVFVRQRCSICWMTLPPSRIRPVTASVADGGDEVQAIAPH